MGYYTYTEAPIGNFIEKEHGNNFEYSVNEEQDAYSLSLVGDYPHKVWVGSLQIGGDSGWRYALVKKTVVYIVTGEGDDDSLVVEKWNIKNNTQYFS
tara:strand:- start:221 stop:511 length:291 start_codon:yes stop_codon:yes gene_type:complete